MYKISVIVPVYNAEKYLKDCIEGIIAQTIDFKNIQLILVDDCSTDRSIVICEEYVKKYNNILLLRTDKNTGVAGRARNKGVSAVEGKYIMFSDADDIFDKDACKNLYDFIEENNADFVTANYKNMDVNGKAWNKSIFDKEKYKTFKLGTKNFIDSFFVLNSSVCNKIFRTNFVKEQDFKFLEGVPGEDAYFTYSALMKTNEIYYCDTVMYYYRTRNVSNELSVSWNCSKKYFDSINQTYKKIYELFKENNRMDYYRFFYAKNLTYMLYKFIDSTLLADEERIEILSDMRWFYKLSPELNVPACQESLSFLIQKIIHGDYRDAIDICEVIADIRKFMNKENREAMSKPSTEFYLKLLK